MIDPIAIPPIVILLTKMKELAAAADYSQAVGTATMTVRHTRNRRALKYEKPVISILLIGDEPYNNSDNMGEAGLNAYESQREMQVEIICDLDLATEESRDDDTGVLYLTMALALFVRSLRGPNQTWLGELCDFVRVRELDPDDRSTPDDGRMTRVLSVLYRVRSDDENVLLAAGVNG